MRARPHPKAPLLLSASAGAAARRRRHAPIELVALTAVALTTAAACGETAHPERTAAPEHAEAPVHEVPAAPAEAAAAPTLDVYAHLDADKVDASAISYALTKKFKPTKTVPLVVPSEDTLPGGEEGALIKRGKQLLSHTFEELPDNVGNQLHCTSCHINAGQNAKAGPWVGVKARFPQYRGRSAQVDDLKTRVNNCFQRSMNGKALERDSEPMKAIIAYMNWLSQGYAQGESPEGRGIVKLDLPREPDRNKGEEIYKAKCLVCHGADGSGQYGADGKTYAFPALWGPNSYNIAAGMARQRTAAGFVKWNMPLGQGGTLTDDEAWDVAGYFIHQPRPDFPDKVHDWPKGNKPPDARY